MWISVYMSGFVTQYPLELRDRQFKGVAKVELLPSPAAVSRSPTNATTNATSATTDAVIQEGSVGTPGGINLSGAAAESNGQGQISRYEAPMMSNGEIAFGYLTAKQSTQGHQLCSIELTEIQKLRTKGDMLDTSNATSAAFDQTMQRLLEKVNPESIAIKTDENGGPDASEVARFRQQKGLQE